MAYYVGTLLVYLLIDGIAALGLNLQYGVAGILSLGFIVFQAAGAYVTAVVTLGPDSANGGFQHYIGGFHWPFPIPLLAAGAISGALAFLVGIVVLRKLRRDYQAMVMLVTAVFATALVEGVTGLFNGSTGLALIPGPAKWFNSLGTGNFDWLYAVWCGVWLVIAYLSTYRVTESPWGRSLRAARDNEAAAAALAKDVVRLQVIAFTIGGVLAGISGALLVQYIGAWAPSGWLYAETFVIFTAIVVGGTGNRRGVILGTFLISIVIAEGSTYLPAFGPSPVFEASMQWVLIGLITLVVLWFRPQGILPEKARQFRAAALFSGTRADGTPAAGRGVARREPGRGMSTTRGAAANTRDIPAVPNGASGERIPGTSTIGGAAVANTQDFPAVPAGDGGGQPQPAMLLAAGISRRFGGVVAVESASLEAQTGQCVGLIGPNGAGKSTLLNILAGSESCDAGRIEVDGHDVTRLPAHKRARLGIVRTFQLASEFSRLTVLENLLVGSRDPSMNSFAGCLSPRWWKDKESELVETALVLLDRVDLAEKADQLAGELSGGERRLVEITRALMADPKILLLDEPTAGVNPGRIPELEDHLRAIAASGVTVLLVEHKLDVIDRVCDNVYVMANGSVLASGQLATLRKREDVLSAYFKG